MRCFGRFWRTPLTEKQLDSEFRVQLKVRVSLRSLLSTAPVIFPIAVRSYHAQSEHLAEIFHLPPGSCDFQPLLDHIAMGTLNLPGTDRQTSGQSAFVIQEI